MPAVRQKFHLSSCADFRVRLSLRTAQRRLALDLFDKRWTVLSEIRAAVAAIVQKGKVTHEASRDFHVAMDRARFFFGPEVHDYLEGLSLAMPNLELELGEISGIHAESAIRKFSQFYKDFDQLLRPYMSMHDKLPQAAE